MKGDEEKPNEGVQLTCRQSAMLVLAGLDSIELLVVFNLGFFLQEIYHLVGPKLRGKPVLLYLTQHSTRCLLPVVGLVLAPLNSLLGVAPYLNSNVKYKEKAEEQKATGRMGAHRRGDRGLRGANEGGRE